MDCGEEVLSLVLGFFEAAQEGGLRQYDVVEEGEGVVDGTGAGAWW